MRNRLEPRPAQSVSKPSHHHILLTVKSTRICANHLLNEGKLPSQVEWLTRLNAATMLRPTGNGKASETDFSARRSQRIPRSTDAGVFSCRFMLARTSLGDFRRPREWTELCFRSVTPPVVIDTGTALSALDRVIVNVGTDSFYVGLHTLSR